MGTESEAGAAGRTARDWESDPGGSDCPRDLWAGESTWWKRRSSVASEYSRSGGSHYPPQGRHSVMVFLRKVVSLILKKHSEEVSVGTNCCVALQIISLEANHKIMFERLLNP